MILRCIRTTPWPFYITRSTGLCRSIHSSPSRYLSHAMASGDDGPSSPPVVLSKEYIRAAFKHLEEIDDVEHRNAFFKKYMTENVEWEITGNGHALAGTRYSLADHSAASFSKLGTNVYLFFVG